MYDDSITTTGAQELLKARLAQAEASLRGTPVTTREDLLATVYSALNAVLSLGNNVTPLLPVAREGPAIAGDLNDNFQILNQDAQAIIKQLLGTENDAATLFNLFASTQNNLRQTVRERIYTSDRVATWRSSSATPSSAPAPRWWISMPGWYRCLWCRRPSSSRM
jgi:septal ring factor EnvC (AmiA/AmiB activator)